MYNSLCSKTSFTKILILHATIEKLSRRQGGCEFANDVFINARLSCRCREIKSVTIWFQNKRQTERKVAANNVANPPSTRPRTLSSPTFPSTRSTSTASSSSRPSLDHVASRSELRASAPRTPNRRHNPNAAIWDNMPSSPLASPASPPEREYVNFGTNQRTRRTLEWACAAARLADKSSSGPETVPGSSSRGRTRTHEKNDIDLDLTDEEADEAITPPSTWGRGDPRWSAEESRSMTGQMMKHSGVEDDDMMNAALALCGLGRRTK